MSAFRYEEFLGYWNNFSDVCVLTSDRLYKYIGETKTYGEIIKEFLHNNHKKHHSIYNYSSNDVELKENLKAHALQYKNKIAVLDFLNNLLNDNWGYLELLEELKIPFIFNLYPGGGFALNNKQIDEKLHRIFSSPMFKKVIVTQKVTRRYLLDNNFCSEENIEFIYGVVQPQESLNNNINEKQYYKGGKDTLDICFAAYKYMKEGKDKGYDLFIETAKKLSKKYNNVKFHVVGTFDETDIDISEISEHITFYGSRTTEWFKEFYKDKDIFLSPNRINQLTTGSFDGFPTGCATEAMLNGVVVIATDELSQNVAFEKGKEIIIVKPNTKELINAIDNLYKNPKEIKQISNSAYKKAQEVYSIDKQVMSRVNILKEEIKK